MKRLDEIDRAECRRHVEERFSRRPHGRGLRARLPPARRPAPRRMSATRTASPHGDVLVGEQYYILASEVAADLPEARPQARRGVPGRQPARRPPRTCPTREFGFYVDGTRFLRRLELQLHGQRPLVLNAGVSEDALQAAVDLTNPDVALGPQVVLPGRSLRIARRLTVHGGQLYQLLARRGLQPRAARHLPARCHFAADFVDVFEVRGHPARAPGRARCRRRSTAPTVRLGLPRPRRRHAHDHADVRSRRPTGCDEAAPSTACGWPRAAAPSSTSSSAAGVEPGRPGAGAGATAKRCAGAAPSPSGWAAADGPQRPRPLRRSGCSARAATCTCCSRRRRTASCPTPASRGTWRRSGATR